MPTSLSRKTLLIIASLGLIIIAAVLLLMIHARSSKHIASASYESGSQHQQPTQAQTAQPKSATNNTSSTSGTASNTNSSNTTTNNSPVAISAISIKDMAFMPAAITIKKGTAVTWTNQDDIVHAIAETDSQTGPHSPQLKKNESYTYTFTQPGTYHYDCAIHPSMTGTVTVTD